MRWRLVLAVLYGLAWETCVLGQIELPQQIAEHQPIVAKSTGDADVFLWRLPSPAKRIVLDGGRTVHIWAPAGTYQVELTTISIDIDWEQKRKDVRYDEHMATLVVTSSGPTPPPDPTPDPSPNPYKPAPAFKAAVEPVKLFSLQPQHSQPLAEMYATVASQSRAGAYKNLAEIRADLVKRGTALNLKGKYPDLASVVERYLSGTLGLDPAVSVASAGDVLETLAWAIYETGRH